MSNIVEGFERSGDREFSRFLRMAKGSVGGVRAQLYVALDAGLVDDATFGRLSAMAMEAGRLIGGPVQYLKTESGNRSPQRKRTADEHDHRRL